MGDALAGFPRVYATHGKVAHLLRPGGNPGGYPAALCGRSPSWFRGWLGTGSQGEHERAAALPLCARCKEKAEAAQ